MPTAAAPATLDGVLVLRGADGTERAFEISANPAAGLPAENSLAWWQALLLAFLGGIVLNAMPCVFPILSLKLLSLAEAGAWPPLGAAGPRARLYGRGARELRGARRRAVGAARRRPSDRLGLSAANAGLCRGGRLSALCDGAEPFRCRRFRDGLRRDRRSGWPAARDWRAHSSPGCWRRSSRPLARRPLWALLSALR